MEDLATPLQQPRDRRERLRAAQAATPLDKGNETGRGEATVDRAGSAERMPKPFLYRPVWLPAAIAGVFLAVSLGVLLVISWNSVHRLQPVRLHIEQLSRLQEAGLNLQEMVVNHLDRNKPIETTKIEELRQEVADIIALDSHLAPASPALLRKVQASLGDLAYDPRNALIAILAQIRSVLAAETRAHQELVAKVDRATALQFDVVVATIIVLPSLALLTLFLVRKRVLVPLSNLGQLLTSLGRRDYISMPDENVDPLLRPLMSNYNALVSRLALLEHESVGRQETLEQQVRAATEALLEQQRTLAAAERLAAVGEVAAGIAHELRNPLAGMQMALSNLRSDITNREHAERLDLVIAELRRITSLLNGLLEGARHTPEPLEDVELARTVGSLLALARHQIPAGIRIECDIESDLDCRLPPDRLKQVLLNLVVNAAQAIGDREGLITISAREDGDMVELAVRDNGPGFPQGVLEESGRPFVTGRSDGTGLGMAIVKRFARDLGGELRLSNAHPHGACVALRLPRRAEPRRATRLDQP